MQIFSIDPEAFLGGIIAQDERQELVQLVMQKGNEMQPYQVDAIVLLIMLSGRAQIRSDEDSQELVPYQIARLEANERHIVRALANKTLILAVKQYG